ncbi:MAG: exodeoxyribonuclease alpha subunit [Clostridiales bacterium]|nr:exodeoxyribonuclease alpha subunit [Clostridiales bacterium]
MQEIECRAENIVYTNEANGFTVLEARWGKKIMTAVGYMPYVAVGEQLLLRGQWVLHPDYGQQFKVESYESYKPTDLKGIERYLASGMIAGIGPSTAKKLVQHFGEKTLDIMQCDPDRLTEIEGIGKSKAEKIAASFAKQAELRQVMVFLQSHGITPSYAVKIYNQYGTETQRILSENPYRMAEDIYGIGFKTADRMAQSLGIDRMSPYRVACGTKYVLSQASNEGHTFLPRSLLIERAVALLEVDNDMVSSALTALAISRDIFFEPDQEDTRVYLAPFYYAETGVAAKLYSLASGVDICDAAGLEERLKAIQKEQGIILAEQQRKAVITALTEGIVVITGGPGTGKTTAINCIIRLMMEQGLKVVLTAPTGRAAKRMTQATGYDAMTIHRLLEYTFSEDEGDSFQRNEKKPLECDAVIVDEVSMVDIILMHNLLKAMRSGMRLVLVGDADQLPSVGPGNVLRDIIGSDIIPVVKLEQVFRQASHSMIVTNAHRINHGQMPYINVKDGDFFMEVKEGQNQIMQTVIQLCTQRLPSYYGYDPLKDIQVLSPMKKGVAGVWNLNAQLQQRLNPPAPHKPERSVSEIIFRLGDRVMQIKNDYNVLWQKREGGEEGQGVFNGDVGYIAHINDEEQCLTVLFDDDKEVVYDFGQLDELQLAYAISVHKSQGSEFPVVVMPIVSGPPMLMARNLLYTAVTRAKELVVLVGRSEHLRGMINNDFVVQRYSGLKERLCAAKAAVAAAERL